MKKSKAISCYDNYQNLFHRGKAMPMNYIRPLIFMRFVESRKVEAGSSKFVPRNRKVTRGKAVYRSGPIIVIKYSQNYPIGLEHSSIYLRYLSRRGGCYESRRLDYFPGITYYFTWLSEHHI